MIHHQRLSAFLLCMEISLCDIFGTTTKAPREAVLICERQMCATKTAFPMRTFTQSSKSSCPCLSPAGRKTAIAPRFPAFLFVDAHAAYSDDVARRSSAARSDTAARFLHRGRFTHRRPVSAPQLIPMMPPGAAAFPPPRSAAWQGKHALWSQGPG